MVDKPATVIAVELPEGEGEVRVNVPEGGEGPAAGLVEERIQENPARSSIGNGEDILAGSGLSAVVDRVDLDKTRQFPFPKV
jgi:hypothetical protein